MKLKSLLRRESNSAGGALPPSTRGRYDGLMDVIDDGFCIIQFIDGPDGPLSDYVHVEANSGYERHTGIPGIVGKSVFDVSPRDGREWVKIYGEVLKTGEPIRFERHFIEAGRYIEVSASPVEPASLQQVAVLFRDITSRKKTEAELHASRQREQETARQVQLALAAGAIVGTGVWDLAAQTFALDAGFTKAMGLPAGLRPETLGSIAVNVHPQDRHALLGGIHDAIAIGGTLTHRFRVRRDNGSLRWLEVTGRVEHDDQGTPAVFAGVLIDVHERRAVEEDRKRVTAQLTELNRTLEQRVQEQTAELMVKEEALRQSHKMEAVGQLTGGLAHDFNNLLTAISGSLDHLRSKLAEGRLDGIERYIDAARGATDRAAAVTQRLLAFSRRQTLTPRSVDTLELAEGMRELIERSIGPQVTLVIRSEGPLCMAQADPNQLENALLNLCINARDAMPGGGEIEVLVRQVTLEPAEAQALECSPGEVLALTVSDTGSGMTPEQINRAFDPYFTTKPAGKGTGLGLSMVYGFARQSGGAVRIDSLEGCGTGMTIYLPCGAADNAAPSHPVRGSARPDQDAAGHGRKVLLVDDEVVVRMVVADALGDAGFTLLEAGTGAEALRLLEETPDIALLLTDIGLPGGMNGRQLARHVRSSRPDLGIIFMTGYDEDAAGGSAELTGIEIIAKPFDLDDLVSCAARMAAQD